ncbi:MAG: hypothetical protein NTV31_07520 [Bacteroidia bacterium]|nr:hypothetical protein [Bacteroidia bacterium]
MMNTYIPETDKNFSGTKMYVLSGNRGERKNQIALMTVYESIQVRDKYYPSADKTSPEADATSEKMKTITEEMMKVVVDYTPVYTDWVIK